MLCDIKAVVMCVHKAKACTAEIEVKANSAGQGVLPCSTAVLEGVKYDWFHQKRTLEWSGS